MCCCGWCFVVVFENVKYSWHCFFCQIVLTVFDIRILQIKLFVVFCQSAISCCFLLCFCCFLISSFHTLGNRGGCFGIFKHGNGKTHGSCFFSHTHQKIYPTQSIFAILEKSLSHHFCSEILSSFGKLLFLSRKIKQNGHRILPKLFMIF